MHKEARAIEAAAARLGPDFADAVEAILETPGRVCVTGMGKAGLIGQKVAATLASTGTLAYSLHPVEALHGDLGMVHSTDVVLALSRSGSSEVSELLPALKALGCRVALVTAAPQSPAASLADWIFEIGDSPEACPLGLAPTSSTAAMLALGDALALCLMAGRDFRAEEYSRRHPGGSVGRSLLRAREIMRVGDECPRVSPDATLMECFERIAKAPRRAGAAVVVDANDRLIGIATHGDFIRQFARGEPMEACRVSDIMTRAPKSIHEDSLVVDGLVLIRAHMIDELPVVDDADRLVGLIDVQDLVSRGFVDSDAR